MKTGQRVIKVSLLVDEHVYEQLSAYAQLSDVSVFEVIRRGLADWTRSMQGARHEHDIKMPGSNVTDGLLPPGLH
jgi:hypothetical protein